MDLGLDEQVAVVTGATRGIGGAVAKRLVAEGCAVIGVGSSESSVAIAEESLDTGLEWYAVDLLDTAAIGRMAQEVLAVHQKVDIVVNCAARFRPVEFTSQHLAAWDEIWNSKLMAYADVIRAFLPSMVERGTGVVVNIVGVAGLVPSASAANVGPVNAAMLNLTRLLAGIYASSGVRFNAVSPGLTDTDRLEKRAEQLARAENVDVEEARRRIAQRRIPGGRPIAPDEVALVTACLCSPHLPSVTGTHVVVDGGLSAAGFPATETELRL